MKDAASLISAIALLLGIVALVALAIRPPAALREFVRGLREVVAAVTRLKVGSLEAEMRHPDVAASLVTGTLPSVPSAAPIDPSAAHDAVNVAAQNASSSPTDEFWRAVGLAHERKYDEALAIVQELHAEVDATRVWRIAFIQYISANEGVEKAFPALRQTFSSHPTYPNVLMLLADALAERGEVTEAEHYFRRESPRREKKAIGRSYWCALRDFFGRAAVRSRPSTC